MRGRKGFRVTVTLVNQSYTVDLQIYIPQEQQHTCVSPGYYHALGKPGFMSKAEHRNGRDPVS